jgi:hypothetical protein
MKSIPDEPNAQNSKYKAETYKKLRHLQSKYADSYNVDIYQPKKGDLSMAVMAIGFFGSAAKQLLLKQALRCCSRPGPVEASAWAVQRRWIFTNFLQGVSIILIRRQECCSAQSLAGTQIAAIPNSRRIVGGPTHCLIPAG